MITHPNCKINLGLQVIRRRADGYHDLQTLFLPVHTLCDELEILPSPAPKITLEGIALDAAPEENLCYRAWQLLHKHYGAPPVSIRLRKGIPFGAGLGGGSSDAAFTLKMVNELFSLQLEVAELEHLAAQLGADCAFFIRNEAAYATGIGDQLQPFPALSDLLSHYSVRIEIPEGEHVSTREAYAGITPQASTTDLRTAVMRPIEEWKWLIKNDFEASVFPQHTAIAALKERMYAQGALYASMTGSGAAVFGIFAL